MASMGIQSFVNDVLTRVDPHLNGVGTTVFVNLEKARVIAARRENYVLFDSRDTYAWMIFLGVFIALVCFDSFVLQRNQKVLSFSRACCYAIFWLFCGVCWNAYVFYHRGWNDALAWSTGYLLEWMLSMDCLFFFHIIFKLFGTPDHLKHIPLFWGIVMAIFFRMFFFLIEEVLMHSFYWTHIVFGLFLVYTGIKSATIGDEHFDPRESGLFVFLCKYIRLVNIYDDSGRLFIKARVDPKTGETILPEDAVSPVQKGSGKDGPSDLEKAKLYTGTKDYGTKGASGKEEETQGEMKWHGTILVLVVMCILITDLIFAVDSVSAVVAEVPDLFLAYTASVFAVLNLRAMFFVTDKLIQLFSLLKYGIASILCIIGVKLMMKDWIHIPAYVMITILISIVTTCILGSLCLNKYQDYRERNSPESTA